VSTGQPYPRRRHCRVRAVALLGNERHLRLGSGGSGTAQQTHHSRHLSADGLSPPPRLKDLNYIFFYPEPKSPGSGFGTGLERLVTALNTDLEWLRALTRYLQRAMEWDAGGRPANRLLSGNDIGEAKAAPP